MQSESEYEKFFEDLMLLFINSLGEYEHANQVVLGLSTEIEISHGRILKLSVEENTDE